MQPNAGGGRPVPPTQTTQPQVPTAPGSSGVAGTVISEIHMVCRLVDRSRLKNSANQELAFTVKSIVQAYPYFTKADLGEKGIEPASDTNTFTFQMDVTLKNPLKL